MSLIDAEATPIMVDGIIRSRMPGSDPLDAEDAAIALMENPPPEPELPIGDDLAELLAVGDRIGT